MVAAASRTDTDANDNMAAVDTFIFAGMALFYKREGKGMLRDEWRTYARREEQAVYY